MRVDPGAAAIRDNSGRRRTSTSGPMRLVRPLPLVADSAGDWVTVHKWGLDAGGVMRQLALYKKVKDGAETQELSAGAVEAAFG